MATRVYFKDYLQEQIEHRFAKKSALGADNEIFNNFFNSDYQNDEKILEKIENQLIFNKNLYFMSPALADAHDINLAIDPSDQLPEFILKESFSDYMKLSGINEDYFNEAPFASSVLKEKFKTVKDNGLKVIFIGYGGAVSNILYNSEYPCVFAYFFILLQDFFRFLLTSLYFLSAYDFISYSLRICTIHVSILLTNFLISFPLLLRFRTK